LKSPLVLVRLDQVARRIVNAIVAATIIEIRPFRNGWKCFEAFGVEPVFLSREDAIRYAQGRACVALARFAFSIQTEASSRKPDGVTATMSAVDSEGRTIWIADADRGGKRFVVRADER